MTWISVKDKMPNHTNIVLCYLKNGKSDCIGLGEKFSENEFYVYELMETSKSVTHWLELPKKPKNK